MIRPLIGEVTCQIVTFFIGLMAVATPLFVTSLDCCSFPMMTAQLYLGELKGVPWAVVGKRKWIVGSLSLQFLKAGS